MWKIIFLFYVSTFAHICGLVTFFFGFLPINQTKFGSHIPSDAGSCYHKDENGSKNGLDPESRRSIETKKSQRLVLMIVDALREDFIFDGNRMPYIQSLIRQGKTRSYLAKSMPPTVTLPRIKAIVTGAVPEFIDVVMNFASTALMQDNIVAKFHQTDRRTIFFGDDTWIKLFPNCFLRHDGTTSFIVSDYTEVDDNVTRHLNKELSAFNWDVMILHFLGLDHIGHSYGPKSMLIGPKLLELDQVIHRIMTSLIEQGKLSNEESLFVLTSDHGMNDAGNHGGATGPEIMTPLVFTSPDMINGKGEIFKRSVVNQFDIAATLAVLFDLEIPKGSVGAIIADLLSLLPIEKRKEKVKENICQLAEQFAFKGFQPKIGSTLVQCCKQKSRCLQNETLEFMLELLRDSSSTAQLQSSGYKSDYMIIGIILLVVSLVLALWTLTIFSSRTLVQNDALVTFNNWLIVSIILHSVSLTSTSYIEEEHQFWYFVVTTSIFVILLKFPFKTTWFSVKAMLRANSINKPYEPSTDLKPFVILLIVLRLTRAWNQSGVKWLSQTDIAHWLLSYDYRMILLLLILCAIVAICYFHLMTTSFLDSSLHFIAVSGICLHKIGNLQGQWLLSLNGLLEARLVLGVCFLLFFKSAMLPYIYGEKKALTKFFWLHCVRKITKYFLRYPITKILNWSLFNKRLKDIFPASIEQNEEEINSTKIDAALPQTSNEDVFHAFLLLYLLVLRPHNIPWMGLVVFLERSFSYIQRQFFHNEHLEISMIVLNYFFGKACYYAQGLSNSISSVDVSAGLIGINHYETLYAGFLVCIATYGSQIFWLRCLYRSKRSRSLQSRRISIWKIRIACLIIFASESAVFCFVTFFNRYHTFIWTVFAPKFLFLFSSHIFFTIFLLIF